ncbi:MAG TPA: hypothetical protein VF062_00975 [Candidatus Limnocylindrales bacterium]|nr:hypothetical protein [Candidatus Limnocylindria bacterium]
MSLLASLGNTGRFTSKRRRIGFALLAAVYASSFSQPALATGGSYAWGSCNWENTNYLPDGDIELRAHSYPGDGWGDGVKNSFNDRITAAINRMDGYLSQAGYVIPYAFYRIPDGAVGEDILVQQANLLPHWWGLSSTYSLNGWSACRMHDAADEPVIWSKVETAFYDHWFTQDDSRRSLWESCQANNFLPIYTCNKKQDFESILMHEFGHALQLWHPQWVDAHQPGLSPDAAAIAACSSPTDRATMCENVAQEYRSSGRTLHAWDRESLRVLETKH